MARRLGALRAWELRTAALEGSKEKRVAPSET
jgi:hypothetical protein